VASTKRSMALSIRSRATSPDIRPLLNAAKLASHTSAISPASRWSLTVGSPPLKVLASRPSMTSIASSVAAAAVWSARTKARVTASVKRGSWLPFGVQAVDEQAKAFARCRRGDGPIAAVSKLLELAGQRRHQEVDLGGEVPVQRADADSDLRGHRANVHSLVTAANCQHHRGIYCTVTAVRVDTAKVGRPIGAMLPQLRSHAANATLRRCDHQLVGEARRLADQTGPRIRSRRRAQRNDRHPPSRRLRWR